MQQLQTHLGWFRSFHYLRISASLATLFIVFILANATLFVLAQKPQDANAQATNEVVEVTEEAATEEKPAATAATEVAAEAQPSAAPQPQQKPASQPARAATPAPAYDKVAIPSIGLSSRFVTVGLTSANAIDVHASLIGWWNGSSQPGTAGAVFLDGHNPGVFSNLPSIQTGAQVTVAKASGETLNYTVVHKETVQLAGIDMRKALSTYNGAAEGLNMMTCVGAYNARTGTTDQRLVVYAVRS